MTSTLLALGAGLLLGLVTGGRPANAGLRPVRAVAALLASVVLQVAPSLVDLGHRPALACILASYALLLGFALANLRLVGMPVILVGVLLNAGVIAANGGMPVRADAVLAVEGGRSRAEVVGLDLGPKRHFEDQGTRAGFLGDVVPVAPLGEVLSFGDLILAFGIADVVFRLLKPAGPIRRRRPPTVAEVVALLPAGTAPQLRRIA